MFSSHNYKVWASDNVKPCLFKLNRNKIPHSGTDTVIFKLVTAITRINVNHYRCYFTS